MRIVCKKDGEQDRIFVDNPSVCSHHAQRGFICFASPLIGAAWYYLDHEGAAERISRLGWSVEFFND